MPDLPETRHSLLIRLKSRIDDDAWIEFLDVYEQAIYAHARRRGLQDADAWDVTQEVLEAVEKKVGDWESDSDRGTFRGWLFRVARNIAVDKIKQQYRRVITTGDTGVARALAEVPDRQEESVAFWNEYRQRLLRWAAAKVKDDFNETTWQAFWLTAVKGEKPKDVAESMKVTLGSVYAAKFRIVKRIRGLVARLDDHDFGDSFLNEPSSFT